MTVSKDENIFIKNYKDEGVNFKRFENIKRRSDSCETSSFSLMRGLAQNKAQLNGEGILGSVSPVRNGSSIMDLIHGKDTFAKQENPVAAENRVSLADAAKPLRNRSSIHAFLSQNLSQSEYDKDRRQHSDSTLESRYSTSSSDKPRYAALFKASGSSEFSQNAEKESLQDIYKRLLQCQ